MPEKTHEPEEQKQSKIYENALKRVASLSGDDEVSRTVNGQIPAFRKLDAFLNLALRDGVYTKGIIVHGAHGIGKTHRLLAKLKQLNLDFYLINSFITPLSLYITLYDHKDEMLVLDDVDNSVVHNPKSMAILKAALFNPTGDRIVTYNSTTKELTQRGIPETFVFRGKIILALNDIPNNQAETFQALLSRVYNHRVELTEHERKMLVATVFMGSDIFGMSDAEKLECLKQMEHCINADNASKYNIRSAMKYAEIYHSDIDGKLKIQLLYDLFETDRALRTFLLIDKYIENSKRDVPVWGKVSIWEKTTGMSRSSYFNTKRRYLDVKYGKEEKLKLDEAEIKNAVDEFLSERKT